MINLLYTRMKIQYVYALFAKRCNINYRISTIQTE